MDKKTSSNKLRVVIVNGRPGSGKTTFEDMCCQKMTGRCKIVSTIDGIKNIAAIVGWNGQKDPRSRKFLSDLKDLCTQYNDYPFEYVKKMIKLWEGDLKSWGVDDLPHAVFVDCREPNEIKKFVEYYGATTLLIRRAAVETENTSNHADANVFKYDYDWIIDNDGTLKEFRNKAEGFLDLLFL